MNILLLNAGSSSLKFSLFSHSELSAWGVADWAGAVTRYSFRVASEKGFAREVSWRGQTAATKEILSDIEQDFGGLSKLQAVGHRIVHGGKFDCAVKVSSEIKESIRALSDLAPLHNPPSLEVLDAAQLVLPEIPHIAVFDTAFHSTLPDYAYTYPIPQAWTSDWGIRRYGFHGLSHAYCSQRAAELMQRPIEELRIVVCHLGHGCSATAIRAGRSIDTTMGFTPLEGLMMGTRSGSIDPSIVFHLSENFGLSLEQIETSLNRESGLLGVSGLSADMREILAAHHLGNPAASLALEIYVHRVRAAIGALSATMGGIDALVFTAGVGEHASEVREKICEGLECLNLRLDKQANAAGSGDRETAAQDSAGRIFVITTREDLSMLKEVHNILQHRSGETNSG